MRHHISLPCLVILILGGVTIAEDSPAATEVFRKASAALEKVLLYDYTVGVTANGMLECSASASGTYGKPDLFYFTGPTKASELQTHRLIKGADVGGALTFCGLRIRQKGATTWIDTSGASGEGWKDYGWPPVGSFGIAWWYVVVSRSPQKLLGLMSSKPTGMRLAKDETIDGVECFVLELPGATDELRAFRDDLDTVTDQAFLDGTTQKRGLPPGVSALKMEEKQTRAQSVDGKKSSAQVRAWIAKSDFLVRRVSSSVHLELVTVDAVANQPTDRELTWDLSQFETDPKAAKARWDEKTGLPK